MASKTRPVACLDACVLYPFFLRNILIQTGLDGHYFARWSQDIHDEWMRALQRLPIAPPAARLARTLSLMLTALPNAMVTDYQHLIATIDLPDPKDRHVVAAAIAGNADCIITTNMRHFPAAELTKFGLVAKAPDDFLCELYHVVPEALIASLAQARRNMTVDNPSPQEFLTHIDGNSLPGLAKIAGQHIGEL